MNDYPQFGEPSPVDARFLDILARARASGAAAPAAAPRVVAPPPPPPKQGTLTDIGHGFARGAMVTLPEMTGKALQAFGADETGKAMADAAAARASDPAYHVNEGGWGEAASSVVPALATAGAAFIPYVGEVAAPTMAAALFGGSQYTDTRERGGTVGQALGTGAVQGIGQAVASHIGGKFLTGAANLIKAPTAEGVLASFANPSILGKVAANTIKAGALQVPVQATAAGSVAAIESNLPGTPGAWEAAKASVAPTLMMTALMAPFAGAGTALNARGKARLGELVQKPVPEAVEGVPELTQGQKDAAVKDRLRAANVMYKQMKAVDPEAANAWHREAMDAIAANREVQLTPTFKFEPLPIVGEEQKPVEQPAAPESTTPWEDAVLERSQQEDTRDPNAMEGTIPREEEPGVMMPGVDELNPSTAADPPMRPAPGRYEAQMRQLHEPTDTRDPNAMATLAERQSALAAEEQSKAAADALTGRRIMSQGQMGVEAASARLEAAKNDQEGAGQGTARALGLFRDSPILKADEKGGVAFAFTKQNQLAWFKELLGSRTPLTQRLAEMNPQDAAEMLREEFHKRGGESAKDNGMVERIANAYTLLTNKNVRDLPATKEAAEQAAKDATTEAAKAASLERAKAAQDALTKQQAAQGGQTVEAAAAALGQGDTNALVTGERNGATTVAQEGNGKGQGSTQAGQGSTQAQAQGQNWQKPVPFSLEGVSKAVQAKYAAAMEKQTAAAEMLMQVREARETVLRQKEALSEKIGDRAMTADELDAMRTLDAEIDRRNAATHLAELRHSDAFGRVNDILSGPEVTANIAHYSDLMREGFKENLLNKFLQARVYSKQATPEEIATFGGQAKAYKPPAASIEAARAALAQVPEKVRLQYLEQARRVANVAEVGSSRRDQKSRAEFRDVDGGRFEDDHSVVTVTPEESLRFLREEILAKTTASEGINHIRDAVKSGVMTPEQGDAALSELMAASMRIEAESKNRGLAGFYDHSLGKVVAGLPHATAVMEHLGLHHPNPVVRFVAKALAKGGSNARVVVVENPDFNGGRYIPSTNTIEIGRGGMNAVTLMHETTHALTHAAIDRAFWHERGGSLLAPHEMAEWEGLKKIRAVMDDFRRVADMNDPAHRLALDDVHEFVSEALTNPAIQQALGGRSGMLTRLYNAIRGMLGMEPKYQTQFEKLMSAATTMFGAPESSTAQMFQRALRETADPSRPMGAVNSLNNLTTSLSGISSMLSGKFTKFSLNMMDRQEPHAWLTLNDAEIRLGWLADEMGKKFPTSKPAVEALRSAYLGFRAVANGRKADDSHLRNGENESQAYATRLHAADKVHPAQMEAMKQMARDARAIGVYPGDKTFAEAQKRNPELLQAVFDHSVAVKSREAYAKVVAQSKQLEARGVKDTPLKLYEDGLAKNKLDRTRNIAETIVHALHDYGFETPLAKQLEFQMHLKDAAGKAHSMEEQELRLRGAMKQTQAAIDAAAKADPTNDSHKGLQSTVMQIIAEHERQSKVPYYHFGHTGSHFISFMVGGGKAEWDRVGAVVGGKLNRDWRDVLPNDNRRVYMMFEDAWAHNEAAAALDGLQKEGLFRMPTKDGGAKDTYAAGPNHDFTKQSGGATPAFISAMKARIDRNEEWSTQTKDQMKSSLNDLHLQQMPETSPLKASMQADNTAGASRDTTDAFITRMEMSNRTLVNARAARGYAGISNQMDKAVSDLSRIPGKDVNELRNKIGVYVEELHGRAADLQTPITVSPIVARARALTATWRLGLAPMYIAMVAYQPWQITMPFIAGRYGFRQTAMAMAKNTALSWAILNSAVKAGWLASEGDSTFNRLAKVSDITLDASRLKNKDGTPVLNPKQLDLMKHLMDSGLINFGMAQQIYRMDANDMSTAAKAQRIAQVVPHYIEMSNRVVAALTAHEMMFGKSKGTDADHEAAKRYAMETIRNTDGDHSQVNVARRLGQRGVLKQATPLVVGFGQYDLQMTELLTRTLQRAFGAGASKAERQEHRKALAGVAVMTSAVAGTLGLPFAGAAAGIYNAVVSAAQDEGDTPPDAEMSWRQGTHNLLGSAGMQGDAQNKVEEVLSRGLPRAAGFDMSGRSGYQDLAPFTEFLKSRQKLGDRLKDGAFNFIGPAFGAAAGVMTGARAAYEGDMIKASNDALPAFARNIAKAYMMTQHGYETSGANAQIPIPMDNWDVMMQGLGALPSKKAEYTEKQFAFTTNQQILQARHQLIMNEIMRTADRQDYAGMQAAMQRSIQFAISQPQFRNFGIAQGLQQRAQQRAIGGMPGMDGVMVSKQQLPYYQRFTGQLPPADALNIGPR